MLAGISGPIKAANHHYWPRKLSSFWADDGGVITRIAADKTILRAPPKRFGSMWEGHRLKADGPWDSTIEPIFQNADNSILDTVTRVETLRSDIRKADKRINYFLECHVSDLRFEFAEIISSLIVRSPAFRNQLRIFLDSFRSEHGPPIMSKLELEQLVVANIPSSFRCVRDTILNHGRLILILSDVELIFSDGFLNTIDTPYTMNPARCVVPLLPHVAVAYVRERHKEPALASLAVQVDEVGANELHYLSQVYTKDYIYFRNDAPSLYPCFWEQKFLNIDRSDWLESLFSVARKL